MIIWNLPSITFDIKIILPSINLILLSLICIENDSSELSNSEHNINTVFLGIIIEEKLLTLSTCMLLEESLWLSVATPVRNVFFSDSVACRYMPFK